MPLLWFRRAGGRVLAQQAYLRAESRLHAIGNGRSNMSGSDPDDLGPGSLKGKTCNVC